jgi:predicted membrane channel-forming protein YqfA (hemolysin III family)
MNDEYKALRSEMLKWQDRRFDLLKISISVVTGLLGFKLIVEKFDASSSSGALWPLISVVLLLYLAGANLLTWYAGVANSKIAAYVEVFHEAKESTPSSKRWEGRLRWLKSQGLDPHNLNRWITVVYVVLGVVSVVLPYAAADFARPSSWLFIALVISAVPFLITVVLVARYSYPRDDFLKHWRKLQEEENQSAPIE